MQAGDLVDVRTKHSRWSGELVRVGVYSSSVKAPAGYIVGIENKYIHVKDESEFITNETKQASLNMMPTKKHKRHQAILKILQNNDMTAREIAGELYNMGLIETPDRYQTQRILSELVVIGEIEKASKKRKCKVSCSKAYVYQISNKNN